MRNQYRSNRDQQERNQDRGYRRNEGPSYSRNSERSSERNAGGRSDWYDSDPMDDRSGYRDEDQNYHGYYGSSDYNPDRERSFDSENRRPRNTSSSYDSDRYSRGQGAYGTTSAGQASWDTNLQSPQRRSNQNYGRGFDSRDNDRSSSYGSSSYGATQGSWSPSEETQKDNSYYGRGPKSFKRSDDRIKEEVCEMLTRHSGIDADDIEVEVKEGEVTLTGSVSERRMKHLAEDCAEQCFGVKDVTNNIRVKRSMDSEVSDRGDFGSSNRDRSASSTSSKKPSSTSGSTPGH